MPEAKSGDAVAFLDLLLEFFADGRRWTRGIDKDDAGNRCLVGAIRYVKDTYKISPIEAEAALREALPLPLRKHSDRFHLIVFNDSRTSFADIRKLIHAARALALKARERVEQRGDAATNAAAAVQAWARAKVAAMLKQHRAGSLAEAEAAARRREAGQEAKRFLLAGIDHERAARLAAGDTRPTWISCPRVPVPERLAA
jgi:hypothetical protein